jgi:predicted DNA-binding transcriptional regulator AlpA
MRCEGYFYLWLSRRFIPKGIIAVSQSISTDAKRHHLDKRAHSLAEQGPGAPDDLLSTQQLATWLGVSVLWLEIGRNKNYGPRFMKLGPRMVRYRRGDVLAWLDSRANVAQAAQ